MLLVLIPLFTKNVRIIEICSDDASVKITERVSLKGWLDKSEIEMLPSPSK